MRRLQKPLASLLFCRQGNVQQFLRTCPAACTAAAPASTVQQQSTEPVPSLPPPLRAGQGAAMFPRPGAALRVRPKLVVLAALVLLLLHAALRQRDPPTPPPSRDAALSSACLDAAGDPVGIDALRRPLIQYEHHACRMPAERLKLPLVRGHSRSLALSSLSSLSLSLQLSVGRVSARGSTSATPAGGQATTTTGTATGGWAPLRAHSRKAAAADPIRIS